MATKRWFSSIPNQTGDGGLLQANVWLALMFSFCFLFSLAMILNVQPAGDGVWFWYATFLLGGKHLYSDMHLVMQPLYVLETAAFLAVLGKGWLVSKVPAVLHALAYCLGLALVARRAALSDRQRALVLGAAFFVSLCFEGYRFDDYHVMADSFQIYSLVLLFALQKVAAGRANLTLCAALGVLSGLALLTRLNDGAALALGVVIAIACLAPSRRLACVALFGLTAAMTVVAIAAATGDSLHNYASYSIFHAAGSKGGTSHVLRYPFQLPVNTLRFLKSRWNFLPLLYAAVAALVWLLLRRASRRRGVLEIGIAVVGLIALALVLRPLTAAAGSIVLVRSASAVVALLCYGIGLLEGINFLRWQFTAENSFPWDRRQILFLIPLGQLASGSMSTAGVHMGLYGPIGVMILLLAICSPARLTAEWQREGLLVVATMLMLSAIFNKIETPYSWHSYREPPMFTARQWYVHPVYGPMIIDRDLLQFIQPVCGAVNADGPHVDLLSIPFPFANYFCAVPPWHGYVQTFFDTSSKATIQGLMDELQSAPPKWVIYQRQLDNLSAHEVLYNQGKPLQQRYLDEMIQHKLEDREWQTVYHTDYETRPNWDNTWTLINTKP